MNISWAMQLRQAKVMVEDYHFLMFRVCERPKLYHLSWSWMEVFFWD
jgi:hypothetical protein